MVTPHVPVDGIVALTSHLPAPGLGLLPIHAFVLRSPSPVLVDAGATIDAEPFLEALDCVVDPTSLAAVVITHEDADHTGALPELLRWAPQARLVVSGVGAGKLSAAMPLPVDRLVVVEHGQRVVLGDRAFRVVQPPMYDSPATFMLLEERERWLLASDAFGGFVPEPADDARAMALPTLLDGMTTFCSANSPWLAEVPATVMARKLARIAALQPRWLLSAHLPPVPADLIPAVLTRAVGLAAEPAPAAVDLAAMAAGAP